MCVGLHSHLPTLIWSRWGADMLIDNDPPITRHISVPRDMSSLSCSALTAGIVEAVLDGLGFVSIPSIMAYPFCLSREPADVRSHTYLVNSLLE